MRTAQSSAPRFARSTFQWSLGLCAATVVAVSSPAGEFTRVAPLMALFVLVAAALTDVVTGRISNELTYGAAAVGVLLALLHELSPHAADLIGGPGLLGAVTAVGCVLAVGAVGLWFGGFGAADLKLAAALAPLVGLLDVYLTVVFGALAVGLLFLVNWLTSGTALPRLQRALLPLYAAHTGIRRERGAVFRPRRLPFAPGLLVGFVGIPLIGPALMVHSL